VENADSSEAGRTVVSSRILPVPRDRVYGAFADPAVLARWWGPNDFANEIHEFQLKPGGRWRLTMRAPDGTAFANESEFIAVEPMRRVEFRHLEPVHAFVMTMIFDEVAGGTRLTWRMVFDAAEECARVRDFIVPANEQNFERLERVLGLAPRT
jgi:uncharacterized protein YndB with AHSA1/START domain